MAELQRARHEARELEGRLGGAEARGNRMEGRVRELEQELEGARRRAEPAPPSAQPQQPDGEEPEEAPASWLFPIYTREFYDSLEGWDRRIQRAAFKQANLLAQDHRHPSLRALPLEGLPGYYRVRVATDVRLIYRRGEQQSAVEILSLIDREDLDRYVRQAKTRD
jgi:mRNA-degrading endonuclease RelE of RelBE toxin-antitoxin system